MYLGELLRVLEAAPYAERHRLCAGLPDRGLHVALHGAYPRRGQEELVRRAHSLHPFESLL